MLFFIEISFSYFFSQRKSTAKMNVRIMTITKNYNYYNISSI